MQAPVELLDSLESILSIFLNDIKQKERSVYILVDNLVEVSCKARLRERGKQFNRNTELKEILKISGIGGELKKRFLRRRKERNLMQHDVVGVTVTQEHCADAILDLYRLIKKLWKEYAFDVANDWVICALRIVKLYSRSGEESKRLNLENYLENYKWRSVIKEDEITFQPALEKLGLEFKSITGLPLARAIPNENEIIISVGSTKHWALLLKVFHEDVIICLDNLNVDDI